MPMVEIWPNNGIKRNTGWIAFIGLTNNQCTSRNYVRIVSSVGPDGVGAYDYNYLCSSLISTHNGIVQ